MSLSRLRARLVPTLVSLVVLSGVLSVAGCKQSDGERCEQDSDCASGICGPNGNASPGTTSAAGFRCVAMLGGGMTTEDASVSDAGASDAGGDAAEVSSDAAAPDAGDAATVEAGGDAASEAGADTGSADGAPSADGATDTGTDGAAAGG